MLPNDKAIIGLQPKEKRDAPFGVLSRDEYNQRIAAGATAADLVTESMLKNLAWKSQSQLRKDPRVRNEGNIGAGVTPAGGSPVGNNRDSILDDIKSSARENPYTGYGERFQAIRDLAQTYQDGEPVRGWERVKGLASSGLEALAAGSDYGLTKLMRAAENLTDSIQRKATGGLTSGSLPDDALQQLKEEAARKDEAFRSYIYGVKPGTSSGGSKPHRQAEAAETLWQLAKEKAAAESEQPEPDEAIRLKDWIFGKRPK